MSKKLEKYEAYEQDLKDFTLDNKHIFKEVDDSVLSGVIFEKRLSVSRKDNAPKVIADCLILSETGQIVGVEYKTVHDTTTRLNKQLRAYSLVCDYVYVFVHDKHVPKVEKILKDNGHHHVGIIAYINFDDEITAGVYKQAVKSPIQNVYHALNMLWKDEILYLLSITRRPEEFVGEIGMDTYIDGRRKGASSGNVMNPYSRSMTKNQLINNLISLMGNQTCMELVCNIYLNNRGLKPNFKKDFKLNYFNRRDFVDG